MSYFHGDDETPQMDTHWFSESGIIDLFVMLGPRPHDLFRQYSRLTGATPLPPVRSKINVWECFRERGLVDLEGFGVDWEGVWGGLGGVGVDWEGLGWIGRGLGWIGRGLGWIGRGFGVDWEGVWGGLGGA